MMILHLFVGDNLHIYLISGLILFSKKLLFLSTFL